MFRYIRFIVVNSHVIQYLKSAHSVIVAAGFEPIDGWQWSSPSIKQKRSNVTTKMVVTIMGVGRNE
ncbi:MAG: hypothetical protein D8M54_14775 [Chloroflexi bacterium]|nr:hypothetical protein [Chloroflexota bacterium]